MKKTVKIVKFKRPKKWGKRQNFDDWYQGLLAISQPMGIKDVTKIIR